MTAAPHVVIITVNWNGLTDTIACVETLLNQTHTSRTIIVVDNASQNDQAGALTARFGQQIVVLRNPTNAGYTGGNNTGISWAAERIAPDYYWLMNNDAVAEPTALSALLARAQAPNPPNILGSHIQYFGQPVVYCLGGGTYNPLTGRDRLRGARQPVASVRAPQHLDYISGCSLFFSAAVQRHLLGFDDAFFLYSEEVDFCLRATRAGFRLEYVSASLVQHKSAQSSRHLSPTYIYYFFRNKFLLVNKRSRWWQRPIARICIVFYYGIGFWWLTRNDRATPTLTLLLQAVSDVFRQRWGQRPTLPATRTAPPHESSPRPR